MRTDHRHRLLASFLVTVFLIGSCGQGVRQPDPTTPDPTGTPAPPSTPAVTPSNAPAASPTDQPSPTATPAPVTLLAAGDIARCGEEGDEATAALLDEMEGTILALGDLAYADSSPEDFSECYAPSWGRHRDRTLPLVGNHEYDEGDLDGYLGYFGERAAPDGQTWYSTDVGAWHVVLLDTNCTETGGCNSDSEQTEWLRDDLEARDARCTLVAMHHPHWSSGEHGDNRKVRSMWRVMYDAGVDVVFSAHDHDYERFAPMTPDGEVDEERGIRSFVVGTGGGQLRPFKRDAPNSEVRDAETYGILRMTLMPDRYDWEFVPVAGSDFTDSGSGECH